jgi:hypothetical protein
MQYPLGGLVGIGQALGHAEHGNKKAADRLENAADPAKKKHGVALLLPMAIFKADF